MAKRVFAIDIEHLAIIYFGTVFKAHIVITMRQKLFLMYELSHFSSTV